MTQRSDTTFGTRLDAEIKASGLSVHQVAKRAGISEGIIRSYVRGYIARAGGRIPVPPTVPTVVKLADALRIQRADLLREAGLEAPARVLAQQPDHGALSVDELLNILRERLEGRPLTGVGRFDPKRVLTTEQVTLRGQLIAGLNKIADQARDGGDDVAADAICDLVEAMDNQLTEMSREEVRQAQGRRRPQSRTGR